MTINYLRLQRRRDIAKKEIENIMKRYSNECGSVSTRKITPEEMDINGSKTTTKEHLQWLKKAMNTF